MENIFNSLATHLNSSVFVLLGILFSSFVVVYKMAIFLGKWQERLFSQDKRLDKVESIYEKVVMLETKTQLIYENTNRNRAYMTASPIKLTDIGIDIVKKIEGDKMFMRYSSRLKENLEEKNPVHPYDIQMVSINVAKGVMPKIANEADINAVKQQAFEYGILDEDIWGIFGIFLRDKILEERGLLVADVDKQPIRA